MFSFCKQGNINHSAMILHQVLSYYKRGWIIYFLLFAYFQQFSQMFCVLHIEIIFPSNETFWLLIHTVFFQSNYYWLLIHTVFLPIQLLFDMYLKWSQIFDTVTNPVSSFQSCHGNWFNIFIACFYKCWLSKSVLGISHWTVCIEWRVFQRLTLFVYTCSHGEGSDPV